MLAALDVTLVDANLLNKKREPDGCFLAKEPTANILQNMKVSGILWGKELGLGGIG